MPDISEHVAVVIKHFVDTNVFHRHATVALGSECAAAQGVFEEYHQEAMRNTGVLGYADAGKIIGMEIEMIHWEEYRDCLKYRSFGHRVADHREEALRIGVGGTPTSFVNGTRVVGAASLAVFDTLVAHHLGRSHR